jgi:hypothetical protein
LFSSDLSISREDYSVKKTKIFVKENDDTAAQNDELHHAFFAKDLRPVPEGAAS